MVLTLQGGRLAARPAPAGGAVSVPVIPRRRRPRYYALGLLWVLANAIFWAWWLRPEHIGAPWLYILFSAALWYDASFLPTVYFAYVRRMRRPLPAAPPPGLRVALITPCVPASESLDVIERQMAALSRVRYPHDSWVLDEGDDPLVRAAAARWGVRHFSRAGVARYNRPEAPFKAKTKAGNVNAWLDAHGHDYDYFVQLDVDHRPRHDYLETVLGYFADPGVAWVQAPSLYGNLDNWVARGAAEQELVLQGPLQQGFYGANETPFIIGSHTAYRTSAIREIGGFQPTRAEDHLDTVVLAAHGHRGVFVPEPLAVGSGPETFETYLRQQFAWANSLAEVLFRFTPHLFRRWRPRLAFQFLFAQTWYPLWSLSMFVLFLVPLLTLATGQRPSTVPLPTFMLTWAPIGFFGFVFWVWTRRWQLPSGLGLSWRGVVLHAARWPIVLWAVVNAALRVRHPYMITPKGGPDGEPVSLRSQAIYLAAIWGTLAVVWNYAANAVDATPDVQGFVPLALWGSSFMLLVCLVNGASAAAALRRRGAGLGRALRVRAGLWIVLAATACAYGTTAVVHVGEAMRAPSLPVADEGRGDVVRSGAEAAVAILQAAATPPPMARSDHAPESQDAPAWSGPVQPTPVQSTAMAVPAVSPTPTPQPFGLPGDRLTVGAYDPWRSFAALPLGLEHWYVRQDRADLLAGALARARDRRTLLVTVEPFPPAGSRDDVLETVSSGRADEELRRLARTARAAQPQVLLLRWGHEMELSNLYPWSDRDPAAYRAAYRRVVELFRQEGASNVRWVWSPAGNPESQAYYPGDDVVDYVGLTVLGDERWDATFGLPAQSFAELLAPKYALAVGHGKPILIAELGVSGAPERQREWLLAAADALAEYPRVRAISYFGDVNSPNNRLRDQPDWRVAASTYDAFLRAAAEADRARPTPAAAGTDRRGRPPRPA